MLHEVGGRIRRQDALEDVWIRHLRVHDETTMVAHARAKVERAGLTSRIEVHKVEPGAMPLPDASVDIVFSKDSIVHIPDKEALTPGNCGTRDFDEGTRSIHRVFGLRISEYLRRNSPRQPIGITGGNVVLVKLSGRVQESSERSRGFCRCLEQLDQ